MPRRSSSLWHSVVLRFLRVECLFLSHPADARPTEVRLSSINNRSMLPGPTLPYRQRGDECAGELNSRPGQHRGTETLRPAVQQSKDCAQDRHA